MPKLWTDTIEEHRRAVHDAALDAAAALIAEHGLASVAMSKIAAATGIGRATLYKYFPDVEALLAAWHPAHPGRRRRRHPRRHRARRTGQLLPARPDRGQQPAQ